MPRLETGEIASHDLPVVGRAKSWIDLAPQVGSEVFVKLFTHGTQEPNSNALLGGGLDTCFTDLIQETGRQGLELRFVSAWEMRRAIGAASKETLHVPSGGEVDLQKRLRYCDEKPDVTRRG